MNQEFENWWDKFYRNAGTFFDETNAIRKAAYHAWQDAYKMGFADGKRAAMGIIDDTFDRYLAGER